MITLNPASQLPAALPANFSPTLPPGEIIRHILVGSPSGIRQTIHYLHVLNYVEPTQWSPLIDIPDHRLVITAEQGDFISLLTKRI